MLFTFPENAQVLLNISEKSDPPHKATDNSIK